CLLSLPAGLYFFLKRANPGTEYMALWGFALAFQPAFLMGFMSFVLSIGLSLVVIGVWLGDVKEPTGGRYRLGFGLTTLLFLTHLGGFMMAGLAIGIHTLVTSGWTTRLIRGGLPFVPGCALFLWAKLHSEWAKRGADYSHWSVNAKLHTMLTPFQAYSRVFEFVILAALAATAIYFLRHREWLRIRGVWLLVAVAMLAVHWIVPSDYGDLGMID